MKSLEKPRRILLIEEPERDTIAAALAHSQTDSPEIRVTPDVRGAYACLNQSDFEVIVVYTHNVEEELPDLSLLIQTAAETPVVVVGDTHSEDFAVGVVRAGAQDFIVRDQCETTMLSRTLRYAVERHRLQRELRDLSLRDELTGLYNRRGFLTLGTPHLLAANRLQFDIGVLYFDLDNLKRINDTDGHAAGDAAILRTAQILTRTLRSTDTLGRMGGDEFAALALGATPRGEAALMARLRRNFDAHNFAHPELSPLSISAGIAFYHPDAPETLEALMQAADEKMYSEKREKKAAGLARSH